jgi:hypothetical protein
MLTTRACLTRSAAGTTTLPFGAAAVGSAEKSHLRRGSYSGDGQKCIAGIGILQYWEKYFTASSRGYCNTYCSNAGYCSKYFVAISRILSKSFCKGRPPIEHLEHFGAMTGGQESAIPQRRANLTLSAPALTFVFSLHTQRSWLSAQAPIQSTAFLNTCGSTLMSVMSMAWSPVKMAQVLQ